jgi:hypothetical protein
MSMARVAMVAIVGLAAGLRFYGLRFGLPHQFARPDENAIVWIALAVLGGDPNPHFFRYPTLFIYVTAAAHGVVFLIQRLAGQVADFESFMVQAVADPTTVYLVPRVLTAAAGTLTVGALYGAAREVGSRRMAITAALLLAVAFLHVRDSHFGVTDVPATSLAVCAFWAAARCFARGPSAGRVAAAGVLGGLAASTKYNMALSLMPLLVAVFFHHRRSERDARFLWRDLGAAILGAAGGFLIGTPFAVLDWTKFLADFNAERLHLTGGTGAWTDRGWVHHLTFNLRYGLGEPLLAATLAGVAWLGTRRSWRSALVLSFPLTYYAAMGAGFTVFARYMVPLVPFACLIAAMLLDVLESRLVQRYRPRVWSVGLIAVLGAVLMLPSAARDVAFDRLLAQPDTRVLAAQWMERTYPAGVTMYQTGQFYGHLVPQPAFRYAQYTFDEPRGRFERNGEAAATLPDVIVLLESPLVEYSRVPRQIPPILNRDYALRVSFQAIRPGDSGPRAYDQQDAFFVPFDRLGAVRRPGPNVTLYERVTRASDR